MVGIVTGSGQTYSRGMNRARVKYLIVVSTIVAIAMIGGGCTSTQSPTIVTVVVAETHVPQPSEQIEVTPITSGSFGIHGETGTTEWWCEDEHCYKTQGRADDDTCRRVERDARFNEADDETRWDHLTRQAGLIDELIAQGKSGSCSRKGPN